MGGCAQQHIDQHIKGFSMLADFSEANGMLHLMAKSGGIITLT